MGKSASEAYVAAGYKANEGNAGRLNRNEQVAARVTEIMGGIAERVEIDAARVLTELGYLGTSNMLDYVSVSADGSSASLDLTKLTRSQAAAITEITTETRFERDGEGGSSPVTKTKLKLADKKGPLELLGKNLGLFKEKIEHSGQVKVDREFSDLEIAQRLAFLLLKANQQ